MKKFFNFLNKIIQDNHSFSKEVWDSKSNYLAQKIKDEYKMKYEQTVSITENYLNAMKNKDKAFSIPPLINFNAFLFLTENKNYTKLHILNLAIKNLTMIDSKNFLDLSNLKTQKIIYQKLKENLQNIKPNNNALTKIDLSESEKNLINQSLDSYCIKFRQGFFCLTLLQEILKENDCIEGLKKSKIFLNNV